MPDGDPLNQPDPAALNLRPGLRDALVRARELVSRGKISRVEQYKHLAEILDGDPGCVSEGSVGVLLTYSRRLAALLDARLGTRPGTLRQKFESTAAQLPADLRLRIRDVVDLESKVVAGSASHCTETELDACRATILHMVGIRPRLHDPVGSPRRTLDDYAVAGVIRAIRYSDPKDAGQHVALADVDGVIVELWCRKVSTIEIGDRIVATGLEEGKVVVCHNFTKHTGGPTLADQTTRMGYLSLAKAGLAALVGFACIVAGIWLLMSGVQRWNGFAALWKVPMLVLVGVGALCLAVWFVILGVNSVSLGRTLLALITRERVDEGNEGKKQPDPREGNGPA